MIASREYSLSKRAIRDLVHIHNFIFGSNPAAATRLVDGIERKIAHIAKIGFTGVSRAELAPNLRAFSYKNHSIYFLATPSRIYVVRILHGRQDISSEDFPESDI